MILLFQTATGANAPLVMGLREKSLMKKLNVASRSDLNIRKMRAGSKAHRVAFPTVHFRRR